MFFFSFFLKERISSKSVILPFNIIDFLQDLPKQEEDIGSISNTQWTRAFKEKYLIKTLFRALQKQNRLF